MYFRYLLAACFLVTGISCRLNPFAKKIVDEKSQQAPFRVNYLSFDETLTRLEKSYHSAPTDSSAKPHVERLWLWANMHANIPHLNTDQRQKLQEFISSIRDENSHSMLTSQSIPETPAKETFSLTLPPGHSLRLPVTGFCLNRNFKAPGSGHRFVLDKRTNESLSRQILFYYLVGRDDDSDFQSLMWDLETPSKKLSSLDKFTGILKELNFEFNPAWNLEEFEDKPSTRQHVDELKIAETNADLAKIEISYIATQGYKTGHVVVTNTATEVVNVTPRVLNQRFVPQEFEYISARPQQNEPNVQAIHISGVSAEDLAQDVQDSVNSANAANEINARVDQYRQSDKYNQKNFDILDFLRNYSANLFAQGENSVAAERQQLLNRAVELAELGLDLGIALTPGLNDARDMYELTTGRDLISDEPLAPWERAISGLSLIVGSGAVTRKGIDAISEAGKFGPEVYAEAKAIAEAVGREGKNGRTVLGSYPLYIATAEELNARRFNIPKEVYSKMSDAQIWEENCKFLDRALARGDEIILSNHPSTAKEGKFFRRELDYLQSKGFKPSPDGRRMVREE